MIDSINNLYDNVRYYGNEAKTKLPGVVGFGALAFFGTLFPIIATDETEEVGVRVMGVVLGAGSIYYSGARISKVAINMLYSGIISPTIDVEFIKSMAVSSAVRAIFNKLGYSKQIQNGVELLADLALITYIGTSPANRLFYASMIAMTHPQPYKLAYRALKHLCLTG